MNLFKMSLILFSLCIYSSVSTAQTVATIGKKNISLKEFKKKYSEIKKQTVNPPRPSVFLEDLVRFEVGVQEAYKKKLEKDPLVKDRMRQELYKGLLEKQLGDSVQKIKVSEREMRRYYKKNPELRTSHILIKYKADANAKEVASAKKRALEIYAEVKKSKRPFEELVKLYTDDSVSKANKGDVGYQSQLTLVPTYYNTALKMKVNSIRGLVRTRYGFHIIKLTGRRSYKDANKHQIRAAVFDSKRKDLFNKYFAKLKRSYKIKLKKNLVKGL